LEYKHILEFENADKKSLESFGINHRYLEVTNVRLCLPLAITHFVFQSL